MPADIHHLRALYAVSDDPWHFRDSAYEAAKFDATVAALPRPRYGHALELGCGNGELARRIATCCAGYTGIDAVETPLVAARLAVPRGTFLRGVLPCRLPGAAYDLIVLSEILYFLDKREISELVQQVDRRWPGADVIAVTWLGPSGNALEGEAALDLYGTATARDHLPVERNRPGYRIDLFSPLYPQSAP